MSTDSTVHIDKDPHNQKMGKLTTLVTVLIFAAILGYVVYKIATNGK